MAATKQGGAKRASLPPIPTAKFGQLTKLAERAFEANTDVFVEAGQRFQERKRAGSSRPYTGQEIAVIANVMGVSLPDATAQVKDAGLVHHDDALPQEMLLAAGVGIAPAAVQVACQFVALAELPNDKFRETLEQGQEALDDLVDKTATEISFDPAIEVRERAQAAMEAFAAGAGVTPGKVMSLLSGSVLESLQQAVGHLIVTSQAAGSSEPSTSSPPNTAGPETASSTSSPGETPAP